MSMIWNGNGIRPPFWLPLTAAAVFTASVAGAAPPPAQKPIVIHRTPTMAGGYLRVHTRLLRDGEPLTGEAGSMNIYKQLQGVSDPAKLGEALDQAGTTDSFGAFLDTGASGHVLSPTVVEQFAIKAAPEAVYHEAGLHGPVEMGVSRPYTLALEGAQGLRDAPDGQFHIVQQAARFQLKQQGASNPLVEMALGGLNVIGMPAIRQQMVEIRIAQPPPPRRPRRGGTHNDDRQPKGGSRSKQSPDLPDPATDPGSLDLEKLTQQLGQVAGGGLMAGPSVKLHPPGHRPQSIDLRIPLAYVNYARRQNPEDRGPLPSLAANPTIEGVTTLNQGGRYTARWLVDTGSPASMISKKHAKALGLLDRDGQPVRPPDFHLPLGGVSGKQTRVPGYRVEQLRLTTARGRTIVYRDVPLLVHDISTTLDNGRRITLQGVFGLNLLLPGGSGMSGLLGALTGGSGGGNQAGTDQGPRFNAVWIDGPRGRLLLDRRSERGRGTSGTGG